MTRGDARETSVRATLERDKHSWNPTNDQVVAQALAAVWGHCSAIERGETPDEWRVSMSAAEVLCLVAAERERCAKILDNQRYMTLEPLRTYTADEAWQTVRSSVKHLASLIRRPIG